MAISRTALSVPRQPVDPIEKIVSGVNVQTTSGWYQATGVDVPATQIFSLSMWIKPASLVSSQTLWFINSGRFSIHVLTDGRCHIQASDSSDSGTAQIITETGGIVAGVWNHVCISVNNANESAELFVNGVEAAGAGSVKSFYSNLNPIDVSNGTHRFFSDVDAKNYDLAEWYLTFDRYIDFSNPDELAKFITSDNKPVNLGSDGHWPAQVTPYFYYSGDKDSFFVNKGLGPDMVDASASPAITTATTSPSD